MGDDTTTQQSTHTPLSDEEIRGMKRFHPDECWDSCLWSRLIIDHEIAIARAQQAETRVRHLERSESALYGSLSGVLPLAQIAVEQLELPTKRLEAGSRIETAQQLLSRGLLAPQPAATEPAQDAHMCSYCGGTGRVFAIGRMGRPTPTCEQCNGTGISSDPGSEDATEGEQ